MLQRPKKRPLKDFFTDEEDSVLESTPRCSLPVLLTYCLSVFTVSEWWLHWVDQCNVGS